MKKLLLSFAVLPFVANAQMAPNPDAGWYGGVNLGYSKVIVDSSTLDEEDGGFSGGAFVGYRFSQAPESKFSVAVEGDLMYASGSTETQTTPNEVVEGDQNITLGVNVVPAFNITPKSKIYGRLGFTLTKSHLNVEHRTNAGVKVGEIDLTHVGAAMSAGAGFEHKISDKSFVRGEYRYISPAEIEDSSLSEPVDFSQHNILVGIGTKF